jgi:predicted  nucleic acid-binding Zn-ribbon protein
LFRSNDETLEMFKHYKNEVENQLNKKIKVIRSDKSGEYEAQFGKLYSQDSIMLQTTAFQYSP